MNTRPIERKNGLGSAQFASEHASGIGRPVIVTDAMEQWPAMRKWDFGYLSQSFGSDFAYVQHGLCSTASKVTRIDAYFDHLDRPEAELPGFWIDNATDRPLRRSPSGQETETPAYLLGWYAFQKHPELYEDIQPAPGFIRDWTLALDPQVLEAFEAAAGREYWSLYVGPAGTLSKLHRDFWSTHSYLAQVRGRKRVMLFSPEDSSCIYEGQADPEKPDFEAFPKLRDATMWEGILGPGDLLYTPPDWWHCVRALEKSITVSHNFFNERNCNEHLRGVLASRARQAGSQGFVAPTEGPSTK